MGKHRSKLRTAGNQHPPAGPAGVAGERAGTFLYCLAAVIALAGLADTTYLTASHFSGETITCLASAGCSEVLGSSYAKVAGMPLAALGAAGYFAAFSGAMLAAFGYGRARTFLMLVVAGMFAVTLWLLYLQAFVLHAFCDYCLLSAALTFALAGIMVLTPARQ